MKVSDLAAPVIEPVEDRYDRDLLNLNDDRKVRGFDYQSEERRSREYVDPEAVDVTVTVGDEEEFTGQVATDVAVAGTVADRYDNIPAGFDAQDFEAGLVYNPNAANPEGDSPEDGASGATAGTPGTFTPAGAEAPADLAALSDVTASPTTAWTTGQHVVLGDGSQAHWDGSAWAAGAAA